MRLSKRQREVMDKLFNGAWIWVACSKPYLAEKDKDGRVRSWPMNYKVFVKMCELKLITYNEDTRHWEPVV